MDAIIFQLSFLCGTRPTMHTPKTRDCIFYNPPKIYFTYILSSPLPLFPPNCQLGRQYFLISRVSVYIYTQITQSFLWPKCCMFKVKFIIAAFVLQKFGLCILKKRPFSIIRFLSRLCIRIDYRGNKCRDFAIIAFLKQNKLCLLVFSLVWM